MKILHVLASNRFSGAENVVCQIIGMFRADPDVSVVYCSPDGQIREALDDRGVSFTPVTSLTFRQLRRVIKEHRPDIIHAHDMRAGFISALAAGKVPVVSHIHGNFAGLNKISFKSIAYYFASLKFKHIFWVSTSSYDSYIFRKSASKKSSVLYNVIDTDALFKKMILDENAYNYDVVFLGRLCWEKNPERLMRVIDILIKSHPNVRVAVIGSGDYDGRVREMAKELNIDKNVDFLGFVSNPLKILHDSKVMIMTSIREGTPMCALEAMTLGVPIVSTSTDGMKDLIDDGITGFLSDDDHELADKLAGVIFDTQKRSFMSENSRKKSNVYNDLSIYTSKLKKVYNNK